MAVRGERAVEPAVSMWTGTHLCGRRTSGTRLADSASARARAEPAAGGCELGAVVCDRHGGRRRHAFGRAYARKAMVGESETAGRPFAAAKSSVRTGRRGGPAMRMTTLHPETFAFWIGMIFLLCLFAPEALATALQGGTSQVCGAAVALGLALIKEIHGDSK